MKETRLKINNPAGMHARPAGELVKMTKSYPDCAITIDNGTRKINAGSILSILSLGLKCGAEVTVRAEGADEDAALKAVSEFISHLE